MHNGMEYIKYQNTSLMRQFTHRKLSILRCRNRVELSSHSLHFAMAFFLTWNLLSSINFSRPTGMEKKESMLSIMEMHSIMFMEYVDTVLPFI